MLDQVECVQLLADLTATAAQLEAACKTAGVTHPARPILPRADVVESVELMEGHVAKLRVMAKLKLGVEGVPLLDSSKEQATYAQLCNEATRIEDALRKLGVTPPARLDNWSFKSQPQLAIGDMQMHLNKLRVEASRHRINMKALLLMKPAKTPATAAATNGKRLTQTTKLLAHEGVSSIEELQAKRENARNKRP
jgi:hypothetical protein